ncbi:hypothetical protein ACFLSQ_05965 [Bacteroidota bacterium]
MKIIITICILFISGIFLQARIITVDNKYPSMGDYTNLHDAHNAANNGDTLYFYPSTVAYQADTISKRLTIIGTGWDIVKTQGVSALIYGTIVFTNGSDGSKFEGFVGYIAGNDYNNTNIGMPFHIVIDADNIEIRKNYLKLIIVKDGHIGNVISQNIIIDKSRYFWTYTLITVEENNEIFIHNNILWIPVFSFPIYPGGGCIGANTSNITIVISHNLLRSPFGGSSCCFTLGGSNYLVENNIIFDGRINVPLSSNIRNNISNSNQLQNLYGNIINVNMYDVFIDPENEDFHLKPNSPAKGTGKNGVDMGIYGGSTPFVDGGYPGIPSIIELDADHLGSKQSGLKVKIKAKSNKD